jgi:hypothetical protein
MGPEGHLNCTAADTADRPETPPRAATLTRGLGHSSTAEYYEISSLAEARAYLAYPVLALPDGPQLGERPFEKRLLRRHEPFEIEGSVIPMLLPQPWHKTR